MADINGLKGGTDKVVRISVMLSGCGKVVLTAYGSDLLLMIDKAAGRKSCESFQQLRKPGTSIPESAFARSS